MSADRTPLWRTATKIGILAGIVLVLASFILRDVQAQRFEANEQLALILTIAAVAGALITVGSLAANYDILLRLVRRRRTAAAANTLVGIVLAVALTVLVCYISTRRFARVDMTGKRFYTLHSKTRLMLRGLDQPVRVTVVYHDDPTPQGQLMLWANEQALDTLSEFRALSPMLTVEEIRWDTDEGRAKLEELARRLDSDIPERCIIFESGDVELVTPLPDTMEPPVYPGQPFRFVGESAFASSLAKIISKEKQTVYFLAGHGERPLEAQRAMPGIGEELSVGETEAASLSRLVRMLQADNFESKTLSLITEGRVPDDCEVLVIAGARSALQPDELEAVRQYLAERNGNLLVLLDPRAETNLDTLLAAYGVKVHTDALAMMVSAHALTGQGPRPLASAVVPVVPGGYARHAITRDVSRYDLLFASCAPIEVVNPRPASGLSARALLTSLEETWGERTMQPQMPRSVYDRARDLAGPVVIGAVVEPATPMGYPATGAGGDLPGPKIVVIGSSYSFTNQDFHHKKTALLLNSANWMAGREQMLGIPPKEITDDRVELTAGQVRAARWLYIFVLPGCVVALGMVVWWVRRR